MLVVVLYHANVPGFAGGFVGVDVFFVLSGYLITGLLVKEAERTGTISLLRFYARRARRLLPASALVLSVTAVASAFVFSPMEQLRLARSALMAAAYSSNLWFSYLAADYFAADNETNPFLHTWSLSVEEQFYFVWPVLILMALRASGSRRRLVVVLGVVSLISFALCLYLTATRQAWAFYGMPTRAWEFGLGGLACLLPSALLRSRGSLLAAGAWPGIGLIMLPAAGLANPTTWPGIAAVVPVIGTILVLLPGGAGDRGGVGVVLGNRPLQRLGDLSYSWYLWHWPVLVIGAALLPEITIFQRLALVGFALALAQATNTLIENPVRFHPRLASAARPSLLLGAALTVLGVMVGLGWRASSLKASESTEHALFVAAAQDRSRIGQRCNANFGESVPEPCVHGNVDSPHTVVLFGDSHASHWFPGLEKLATSEGWRLVTLTKASCSPANIPIVNPRFTHPEECSQWRRAALEQIAQFRPSVVVLGYSVGVDVDPSTWQPGWLDTYGAILQAGSRVVVIGDTPRSEGNLPECLSRARVQSWLRDVDCTVLRPDPSQEPSFLGALEAGQGKLGVTVIDLTDDFCGPETCSPMQHGTVLLHDGHHLAASQSIRVATELRPYLSAELP